jgi:hypothetical protein
MKRARLSSNGTPFSYFRATRTGKTPLSGRFASNNSWLSSSPNRGATVKLIPPVLAVRDAEGSGGSSTTGLTLNNAPPQPATRAIDAIAIESRINFTT